MIKYDKNVEFSPQPSLSLVLNLAMCTDVPSPLKEKGVCTLHQQMAFSAEVLTRLSFIKTL